MSLRRKEAEEAPPLLGPEDPPAVVVEQPESRRPLVITVDHASNAVPVSLDDLGLDAGQRARHFAWDPGAAAVAARLGRLLGATVVRSGFSRLVIDPNRALDDPTSIPVIGEDVVVPGNRDLTPARRAARAEAVFHPYHDAVSTAVGMHMRDGRTPVLLPVHTFTPAFKGRERPWDCGVLWNEDGRLARPLIAALAREPGLRVGDNKPYTGRNAHGYATHRHGDAHGLAYAVIEIRNDRVPDDAAAEAWAARLARVLDPLLAEPSLYAPREPAP